MEHQPDFESLDQRQQQALNALLEYPTVSQAIRQSGIPRTTMYRYLQDETFSEVYKAASRQSLSHATARLQAMSGEAVNVLVEIALDPDPKVSSRIRVAAANAVLQWAYKAAENYDLEDKLEELERLTANDQ